MSLKTAWNPQDFSDIPPDVRCRNCGVIPCICPRCNGCEEKVRYCVCPGMGVIHQEFYDRQRENPNQ